MKPIKNRVLRRAYIVTIFPVFYLMIIIFAVLVYSIDEFKDAIGNVIEDIKIDVQRSWKTVKYTWNLKEEDID